MRREALAWATLGAVALALRLWQLDARPFQYDEGQIAYFSWVLLERGEYTYMPVLHGPVTYYLNALAFLVAGASDFTARLTPAVAGTALVMLPLALRRQLGRAGALAAGGLFAISPTFLYYSRFDREDIVLTCLELALLAVAVRLFERPRAWHPAAIGALLAACFATKEATFITAAIAGAGLIGAQVGGWPVVRRLAAPGARAWMLGAAAFALVFALLFSRFLAHPEGVIDGIYEGPRYWLEQHPVNRGGEQWPLYLVMLVASEWLVLALGLVGSVVALRQRRPLGLFLVWVFAASLAGYSYAGERFAWLALQPLLPLVLLAGIGVEWMFSASRERLRPVAAVGGAAAALVFALTAVGVSFRHGTDPRELQVVVQSDPDVRSIRDEVLARARRDPELEVLVDSFGHSAFPWAWYFRDLDAGYADVGGGGYVPREDALILSGEALARNPVTLRLYDRRPFTERRAWTRDYGALTPAALLRWETSRRPFGQLGSQRRYLLTRRATP